ncbi:hypothetical protein LJC20_05590 [Eubacteriales bacterium OttesenSCG-928-M02]|nr:hypothetical protein [Eubacteriales bacterium OttesenSCG-928-M02]
MDGTFLDKVTGKSVDTARMPSRTRTTVEQEKSQRFREMIEELDRSLRLEMQRTKQKDEEKKAQDAKKKREKKIAALREKIAQLRSKLAAGGGKDGAILAAISQLEGELLLLLLAG